MLRYQSIHLMYSNLSRKFCRWNETLKWKKSAPIMQSLAYNTSVRRKEGKIFIYLRGWSVTKSTITAASPGWKRVMVVEQIVEWMNGRGNRSTRKKRASAFISAQHYTSTAYCSVSRLLGSCSWSAWTGMAFIPAQEEAVATSPVRWRRQGGF
jgi:hypothetical protein